MPLRILAVFAVIVAVAGRDLAVAGEQNATAGYAGSGEPNATEEWEATKESKMSAVNKIVKMLEDLQEQVTVEGEEEAHMYNKFACFCKDTIEEKGKAIQEGADSKDSLIASIGEKQSRRDELDSEMRAILKDIEKAQKMMKKAQETRDKQSKQYQADDADLKAALEALEGALQELKASKVAVNKEWTGFAQMRQVVGAKVRHAILIAEALGIAQEPVQRAAVFFQEEPPEVQTEAYSFKSADIITTLEDLEKKFKDMKVDVDKVEVKAAADHDMFMQDQSNIVKTKERELSDAKAEKSQKMEEIASDSAELTTVAAVLLDDQAYLKELSNLCSGKKKTWDQRSSIRADELNALTAVLQVLKGVVSDKVSGATVRFAQWAVTVRRAEAVARNEDAMEAVEASIEASEPAGPPSFLQQTRAPLPGLVGRHDGGEEKARQAVMTLLKSRSMQLKSAALASLVGQIGADDPFAKVKALIEELIERLLKEASSEATQKGWCDKSMSAASQKRDYAAEKVAELNGNMAELEALRDKLAEELSVLRVDISKLKAAQKNAKAMREREKREHKIIISEATIGIQEMHDAIDLIDKFYKKAKKSEVNLAPAPAPALVQEGRAPVFEVDGAPAPASREFEVVGNYNPPVNSARPTAMPAMPGMDAPDTGFSVGEAYMGAQGESEGVIGMMEVIRDDFKRTIEETEEAEAQAQQDFLEFMTDTGKSLAEKKVAEKERSKQMDDTEEKLQNDKDSLTSQTDILKTSIQELMQLHGACVDTGISMEERMARREDEIDALKKALCILDSYAKYGVGGIGDDGSC